MKNQLGMRLKLTILKHWCLLTIAMLFLGK
jgi:hypothetical protein